MKIAIIGAQGVGKTTLIKALSEHDRFKGYLTPQSASRTMVNFGYDISKTSGDIQYGVLLWQYYNTMCLGEDVILDRCVLDNFAYMLELNPDDTILPAQLNMCSFHTKNLLFSINKIVFIRPSFELEDDGVRSVSTELQHKIDSRISDLLMETNYPEYNILTIKGGTVEERVKQVAKWAFSD